MFQHILVPLDGSLRAERTLPIAARLAQASQGNLILLRVVEASAEENAARSGTSSPVHQSVCAQLDEAQQYLAALARAREIAGIPLTIEVRSGPVVSTILAAAQTSQADLLILCRMAHRRMTRPWLAWLGDALSRSRSRCSWFRLMVMASVPGTTLPRCWWLWIKGNRNVRFWNLPAPC
jgi:nucleotide-binding universal stress UspA family protein